jgi:hypothetical protein
MAGDNSESFVPEVPTVWSRNLNIRSSVGYNDNLLQDATRSDRSLSLGTGIEFSQIRLPLDGRQLLFFIVGDYTFFPDGERVEHEASLLGLAQLKLDLSPRWQAAVDLQYLFLDQVIDTSITETNLSAALVRGHGLTVRPSIRTDLAGDVWIELGFGPTRQFLDEPFDDYWEGGPKLVVGQDYGNRSSIALGYVWKQRVYDTREEISLSGTNLPGTELQFQIHEAELSWRHNWDARRRWRTLSRLQFLANEDQGSGYFDYRRYQASQQWRYVATEWEAKVQARIACYDFIHQAVSATDPDSRAKTVVGVSFRGERRISKYVRLFADYSFEQSLSSRTADEYRLNRIAVGVDCGF